MRLPLQWLGTVVMPIQRGDIDFVNLNPVQGREQAGQRPVLVLSIDTINRLPLVVTVVVGTKGDNVGSQTLYEPSCGVCDGGGIAQH